MINFVGSTAGRRVTMSHRNIYQNVHQNMSPDFMKQSFMTSRVSPPTLATVRTATGDDQARKGLPG
jgi:hypothetical protein